jgi:multidrug efflux pump subunit AcrA (membrane-fusion protein)
MVCVAVGAALQKELTKKVQRIDALQADVNKAADARTAAETKAEELAKQADLLRQQLAVLGSKDGELQTLAADLAAAASAKAALEAKVGAGYRLHVGLSSAGPSRCAAVIWSCVFSTWSFFMAVNAPCHDPVLCSLVIDSGAALFSAARCSSGCAACPQGEAAAGGTRT